MSYMVIYRGNDGRPAYQQYEEVHDAVSFVEELRNEQGIEHVTLHRMEQVNFEYRPYFRVELRTGGPELGAGAAAPAAVAAPTPAPAVEAPQAQPQADTPPASPAEPAATPATEPEAEAAPSTPRPTPTISTTPTTEPANSDAGVGARRGLFGR